MIFPANGSVSSEDWEGKEGQVELDKEYKEWKKTDILDWKLEDLVKKLFNIGAI